jgi:gliding motility-associated-like protein
MMRTILLNVLFSFQLAVFGQFGLQDFSTTDVIPCSYSDNGSITINITSGNGNYIYSVYNMDNPGTPVQSTGIISDLSHTFNGLEKRNDWWFKVNQVPFGEVGTFFVIDGPDPITIAFNHTSPVDACNGIDISVTGSALGGSNNFISYVWSMGDLGLINPDNAATTTFNSSSVGSSQTYTLTVTDDNGCIGSNNITFDVYGLPTAVAGSNSPICSGTDLDLTESSASPGITTYAWTGPNSFSSSSQNPTIANATTAADGLYTVTITDNHGCMDSDDVDVTVYALPTPDAGTYADLCVDAAPIVLTGTPTNAGGSWSGSGVTDNGDGTASFDPSVAGAGAAVVTYDYTDGNGCTASDNTTITVDPLPTPDAGTYADLCVDAAPIVLTGTPTNANGSWSGSGVTDNGDGTATFDPSVAGAGATVVTYDYTDGNGCTASDNTTITVDPLPTPDAGTYADLCVDAAPIVLTGTPTNAGGSWSGSGVTDNGDGTASFDPSVAGAGAAVVTYDYTDGNGCTASDNATITVDPLPTPDAGTYADLCVDAAPIVLTGTPTNAGGSWSGSGVTDNGDGTATFNPSVAGAGAAVVTYDYTDGNGCTASDNTTITVDPLPTPDAGTYADLCVDAAPIVLTGTPTNAGGSWSGSGVTDNGDGTASFDPSVAGAGAAVVTYDYTDGNGCTASDNTTITVDPLPTPDAGTYADLCVDAAPIVLTGTPTNANGSWSGSGVTDNGDGTASFDPSVAGAGAAVVTYDYTDGNGCTASDNATITVDPLPTPDAGTYADLCVDAAPIVLTGTPTNANGSWSGSGVTDNGDGTASFNPSVAGAGATVVTYDYTDGNGCTASDNATITVDPLPTPDAGTYADLCVDAAPIVLTGTPTNAGGSWSGSGVTDNGDGTATFDPSVAGAGAAVVTYDYTDGNGCTASDNATITVDPLPTPDAGTYADLCVDAAPIVLTGTPTNAGGSWSGSGVTDNGDGTATFDPSVAGAGATVVTYDYTDGNGCTASDNTTITVDPLPTPTIAGNATACVNSAQVYSTEVGRNNYIWTISGVNGSDYTINSGGGVGDENIEITWITAGPRSVRVNYNDPVTGCDASSATVHNVTILTLPNPTISGDNDVCQGETGVVYTTESGNLDYDWDIVGGNIIAGGTILDYTATVQWTTAGAQEIRVNYDGGNGCLLPAQTIYPVNVNPEANPTITGNATACIGVSESFTTEAGQNNYDWSVSGTNGIDYTIDSGGGVNDDNIYITWLTSGAKTVTVNYEESVHGCSALSATIHNVNVNNLPIPTVVGNTTACIGVAETYSTAAGQNNYVWSVSGTNGVDYTINSGGGLGDDNIDITWLTAAARTVSINYEDATTGCTAVSATVHNVNVNSLPIPIITGNASACIGVAETYSTEAGQNNYVWSVSGTNGVDYTINSGGGLADDNIDITWLTVAARTVSVNYEDVTTGCTAASSTVHNITVNALPVPSLAGDNSVCQGEEGVIYSTDAGMNNYDWQITGGTITSGGTSTDNSATVTWTNFGFQEIRVNYTNPATGCSASSHTVYNVTVLSAPVPALTGDNEVCDEDAGLVYSTNPGMTNYDWQIIGGTITSGGSPTDPTATVTWTNPGTRLISVNFTGGNGCRGLNSTDLSVTVHPLPVPTITGSATACVGVAESYITEAGQDNYLWTVSGTAGVDYTINSGGGATDDNIDITWLTDAARTISVNYDDPVTACSAASATVHNVTVNPLPIPTITGSATACVGIAESYTTESGQDNYVWSVSGTAGVDYTINSGGGATDDNIDITWLTDAARTVSVNYDDATTGCAAPMATLHNLTVNPLPIPTITGNATACVGVAESYTTESGQDNYVWTVSGTAGVDYTINSGGGATDDNIDITWLTDAARTVSVNYDDATTGCAAPMATLHNLTVNPLPIPTITGSATACVGVAESYITEAGQDNYVWTVSGTAGVDYTINSGGGATDDNIDITWLTDAVRTVSITYEDAVTNCTPVTPTVHNVTVNPLPIPTITGSATACVGVAESYTTESGQDNYVWSVSGTAGFDYTINSGGGATDDNIDITWLTDAARTVSVNYDDPVTACSAASATVHNVTVNPLPTPTITGNATACVGVAESYTTESGQDNYVWTVSGTAGVDYTINSGGGATDDNIDITWLTDAARTVSVNYDDATTGCAAPMATLHNLTVNPLPIPTITGSATACVGVAESYITEAGQDNYVWTISGTAGVDYTINSGGGATDDNIDITWLTDAARTVSVNYDDATTGCAAPMATLHNLTVNPLPIPTITGSATACVGVAESYTTESGQDNYVWTISGTAGVDYTINLGGGATDDNIDITWLTDAARTISVNYDDATTGCAAPMATLHNLTVNPLPIPTITGNATACVGVAESYITESGQDNYVWTVSGTAGVDYTINSGGGATDDNIEIIWHTATPRTVGVNYENPLTGCTAESANIHNVTVNPLPVPTITGNSAACVEFAEIYSTEAGQDNYVWSVSGVIGVDYTINSGGGPTDNSINLTWHTVAAFSVSVAYDDGITGCSTALPTFHNVTVNALPVPTITGNASACIGNAETYSTEAGQNNYVWTISGVNGVDFTINTGGSSGDDNIEITWLTAASRTVSVNYENPLTGCAAASSAIHNVTVNALPEPTIAGGAATCVGIAQTYTTEAGQDNYLWSVSGVNGVDYTINSGGGSGDDNIEITWHTAASHTVSVNYENPLTGCSASSATEHTITVNARPVPTITGDTLSCENISKIYTTQAGMSNYNWYISGTAGVDYFVLGGTNNQSLNVLWQNVGSYKVSVNYDNAAGCAAVEPDTTLIQVTPATEITLHPINDTVCQGDTAVFTVGVAGTEIVNTITRNWYVDYDGDGLGPIVISSLGNPNYIGYNTNTLTIVNVQPSYQAEYFCLALGDCGNIASNRAELVVVPTTPISFSGLNSPYCQDASLADTLYGSQAPNGTFSGIGVTDLGNGKATFTPGTPGNYNITYAFQSGSGCWSYNVQPVTVQAGPNTSLALSADSVCLGDTAYIDVFNTEIGVRYQLRVDADSSAVPNTLTQGNGGTITLKVVPTATTLYHILAQRTSGMQCTAILANKAEAYVSPPIVTVMTSDVVSCPGESDGTVAVAASGGIPGYTYQWYQDSQFTQPIAGATLTTLGGQPQGTYYVLVTDIEGCTTTDVAYVSDPDPIVLTNATITHPTCMGSSDAGVSFTAAGGTGLLEYSFDGSAFTTNTSYNGYADGDYTLDIRDSEGCTFQTTISFIDPLPLEIDTIIPRSISCQSKEDGVVTVMTLNGSGIKQFILHEGTIELDTIYHADSASFMNLKLGDNYWVEVTDNCETIASDSVSITFPDPISILSARAVNMQCNSYANDSIVIDVDGGNLPYIFMVFDATLTIPVDTFEVLVNPGFVTGIGAGSYRVVVTDTAFCTFDTTDVLTITEPQPIILTRDLVTDVSCGGQSNGAIHVSAVDGQGAITYGLFDLVNGDTLQLGASSGIFNNLAATQYEVRATDAAGCFASDTIALTQPPAVVITYRDSTEESCYGTGDGALAIHATGGQGTLTYSLLPGNIASQDADTGIFINLLGGQYIAVIEDTVGCQWYDTLVVPSQPEILVTYHDTLINDTIRLTIFGSGGRGDLTYQIVAPDDSTYASQDTGYYEPHMEGWFDVVITDTAGCSLLDSVFVDGQADLDVEILIDSIDCPGEFGRIIFFIPKKVPSDILTFIIDRGTVSDTLYSDSINVASKELPAGLYDITVKAPNGGTFRETVILTDPVEIEIDSVTTSYALCNGSYTGSIKIYAHGGTGQLQYSINTGNTYQVSDSFPNLRSGAYDIRVEDANGCEKPWGNVSVEDNPVNPYPIVVNNITFTDIKCHGDSTGRVEFDATGGYGNDLDYWLLGPRNLFGPNPVKENLPAGIYSVSIMDTANCLYHVGYDTIHQPGPIQVTSTYFEYAIDKVPGRVMVEAIHDSVYVNDTILVLNDTNLMYTLSSDYFTYDTLMAGQTFFAVDSGLHTITIMDSNACTATSQLMIEYFDNYIYSAITPGTSLLCAGDLASVIYEIEDTNIIFGQNRFEIYKEGSTGVYFQRDARISSDWVDISGGTYFVHVHDANHRHFRDTLVITEPLPLFVSLTSTPASCEMPLIPDGLIRAQVFNGTSPYIYQWRDTSGAVIHNAEDLESHTGIYYLRVIDNNGCMVTVSDTIGFSESISVSLTANDVTVCPDDNQIIPSVVTNASGPIYTWSPYYNISSQTSASPVITVEGDTLYTVRVASAAGCYATDTLRVGLYSLRDFEILGSDTVGVQLGAEIDLEASEGFFNYRWVPGTNLTSDNSRTTTATGQSTIKYKVQATDDNGCGYIDSVVVRLAFDPDPVSGFTPDGDGVNDLWYIEDAATYGDRLEVFVFNRWGQRVFYSKGYSDDKQWNGGKFNNLNKKLPFGTYYFIIKIDGNIELTGPITIVQ